MGGSKQRGECYGRTEEGGGRMTTRRRCVTCRLSARFLHVPRFGSEWRLSDFFEVLCLQSLPELSALAIRSGSLFPFHHSSAPAVHQFGVRCAACAFNCVGPAHLLSCCATVRANGSTPPWDMSAVKSRSPHAASWDSNAYQ